MAPHVTREADVEQVLQRHPPERRSERQRQVPHRRRRPPPALDRFRPDRVELLHDLVVREVFALADLQLVQAVDPVVGVDLLVERHAPAQLVHELADRRLRVARPENMQDHLADVPRGAVRGHRPLLRRERRNGLGEANELRFGENTGFLALDAVCNGDGHRLLLVMASST